MFESIKKLKLAIRLWGLFNETKDQIKKEESNMEAKSLLKSKTFWWNLFSGVATALTAVVDSSLIADPKVIGGIALANTIVNIILRAITTQPVSMPGQSA